MDMLKSHMIGMTIIAGLLAPGCSTRPRNFAATVSTPVVDRTAFESDFRTCQTLARQGYTSNFKGAAASALATGAGTLGTGVAMVGTGMVGITTSGAAAAAATAAMPVVGILVGVGVSRTIRAGKERKLKRAMGDCLAEYGYSVDTWARVNKRDDAARISAEQVTVAMPQEQIAANEF
ncbi:MAG: hypothetical protein AB7U35_07585 [Sphingobium sp.]